MDIKIGMKFGKLTVIGRDKDHIQPNGRVRKMWICRCECGKVKSYRDDAVPKLQSCGCERNKENALRMTKHSLAKTRLYKLYYSMMNRCHNVKCSEYNRYGGRGIEVCEAWRKDNTAFFKWAEENGYDPNRPELSLERIDVDGNYCPENCKWIELKDQYCNMRKTVRMANLSLAEFCRRAGLDYRSVYSKYYHSGDIVYALGLSDLNKEQTNDGCK